MNTIKQAWIPILIGIVVGSAIGFSHSAEASPFEIQITTGGSLEEAKGEQNGTNGFFWDDCRWIPGNCGGDGDGGAPPDDDDNTVQDE